jgi:hypothetical protein
MRRSCPYALMKTSSGARRPRIPRFGRDCGSHALPRSSRRAIAAIARRAMAATQPATCTPLRQPRRAPAVRTRAATCAPGVAVRRRARTGLRSRPLRARARPPEAGNPFEARTVAVGRIPPNERHFAWAVPGQGRGSLDRSEWNALCFTTPRQLRAPRRARNGRRRLRHAHRRPGAEDDGRQAHGNKKTVHKRGWRLPFPWVSHQRQEATRPIVNCSRARRRLEITVPRPRSVVSRARPRPSEGDSVIRLSWVLRCTLEQVRCCTATGCISSG